MSAAGVDPMLVREGRRRFASGVTVVLTQQGDGFRGATVSSFAIVSLEPPALVISLDYEGRMSTLVPETGRFTVSILGQRHEFAAERFAGRAPLVDERLSGVAHELAPSGLPVLTGALAWSDCRVQSIHDGGDHLLVVGAIDQVMIGPDTDAPLVFYEGRYRSLDLS